MEPNGTGLTLDLTGSAHWQTLPAQLSSRPWLRWYEPGAPGTVEVPDQSLPQFLAATAAHYPTRSAIRFFGRKISYPELDDAVNRFANVLLELGVKKGDRVGLLLPTCPQFVIAFYGCLRMGAIPVPASPLAAQAELQKIWDDAGVRVVVCLSALLHELLPIRADIPSLQHVVVTNIKEYFPPLLSLLFTVAKERKEGHRVHLPDDGASHWMQRLLRSASPRDPIVKVAPDDLALLQPTGGTTGIPKLAMLTHRNLLANAIQVSAWLHNETSREGGDVILGVLPLFHIYAITTVLNFSVVTGATMILQPRFVLKDVLKAIDREKPDFLPGVPTIYTAINHAPDLQRYNLRSLKAAISGAAPLRQQVQEEFESLTGARLVEGYGLTEASPVTHCTPMAGRRKLGTIGLPMPVTDAAVFDQATGTHMMPPGEIGELAVRGPQVMLGYWRRERETAEVLRNGWLFTGDIATTDEDGYFTIVDRKKDLIISGGMNVYPREVEEPLFKHPKVQQAVAVGVPDDKWGEVVKVYVVLEEGQTATEQEIVDYCHEWMARYKVPKEVEFRSELPQNLIGKVLRRKLREEELARRREVSRS